MSSPEPMRPMLGVALRQAWVGYRRRLDAELAAAGFSGGTMPDGRVLRICARSTDVTISAIGSELGITRQGASKIVAGLRDRGYVTLRQSADDARQKLVTPTPRALEFLQAHRRAVAELDRALREQLGDGPFQSLRELLAVLGADDQPRMRDYLRQAGALAEFDDPGG